MGKAESQTISSTITQNDGVRSSFTSKNGPVSYWNEYFEHTNGGEYSRGNVSFGIPNSQVLLFFFV